MTEKGGEGARNSGSAQGGFASVSTVIKSLAVIVALFPGILALLELVDIPPTLIDLVKIISFSVSLIVLISVFLMRNWIYRIRNETAAVVGILAVLAGACCATGYFQFANKHTFSIKYEDEGDPETYIIPRNPSPELKAMVAPFGGSYERALRTGTNSDEIADQMGDEALGSMAIMIVLLILSQILLIAPVVAAAWKLAGVPPVQGAPADQAEPSA